MKEKYMQDGIKKTKKDEMTTKKRLSNWHCFLLTFFMTRWHKKATDESQWLVWTNKKDYFLPGPNGLM